MAFTIKELDKFLQDAQNEGSGAVGIQGDQLEEMILEIKEHRDKHAKRIKGCSICQRPFRFHEEIDMGVCAVCVLAVKSPGKVLVQPQADIEGCWCAHDDPRDAETIAREGPGHFEGCHIGKLEQELRELRNNFRLVTAACQKCGGPYVDGLCYHNLTGKVNICKKCVGEICEPYWKLIKVDGALNDRQG
jgi:hypothetical protein